MLNITTETSLLHYALVDITEAWNRDRLMECKGVAYGISLYVCRVNSPGFPESCGRIKWLINELVKAKLKELHEADLRRLLYEN